LASAGWWSYTAAEVTVLKVEPGRKPYWNVRDTRGLWALFGFSDAHVYRSTLVLCETSPVGS
jgi:hypothetical protein